MCSKLLTVLTLIILATPLYAEDYVPSLVTATPYEGRQLAIKLARKSIGEMQSDPAVKKKIRGRICAQRTSIDCGGRKL